MDRETGERRLGWDGMGVGGKGGKAMVKGWREMSVCQFVMNISVGSFIGEVT